MFNSELKGRVEMLEHTVKFLSSMLDDECTKRWDAEKKLKSLADKLGYKWVDEVVQEYVKSK